MSSLRQPHVVPSQPTNPALSEKGRAFLNATGAAPSGAGARRMCAPHAQRESVVLETLGANANALNPSDVRAVLAEYPGDSMQPNMELVREVEMAATAAHGIVPMRAVSGSGDDDDDDDDDQTELSNNSGVASLPAARTLGSYQHAEKKRMLARMKPTSAEASLPAAAEAVSTTTNTTVDADTIAGPGGMLEHSNMDLDAVTKNMSETQIALSRLVVKGTVAVRRAQEMRAHATALAESGARPHDVPLLTAEWMSFLTRHSDTGMFPACKNGVNCFGMRLDPGVERERRPLVVFHTPAQWQQYLNCGQQPLDMAELCVWCLALATLSAITTVENESTSSPLLAQCLPFRNLVDAPGGYRNEYCARPTLGARAAVTQYAMRMPSPKQFVPVMHNVQRPKLNNRGIVMRAPDGRTLCTVTQVFGYAEEAKVMFVDGQQATLGGTRIEPDMVARIEHSTLRWEHTLRDAIFAVLFDEGELRKHTTLVVQQDRLETDMAAPGMAFVEEDTFLARVLDIALRSLEGAHAMVQRIGAAHWGGDEKQWYRFAAAHGLVYMSRENSRDVVQLWDQLTMAVRMWHRVQKHANEYEMPRVSTHLLLYMIVARLGLHSTLEEMLPARDGGGGGDLSSLEKRYTQAMRTSIEKFSEGHVGGYQLLTALLTHGYQVDDVTLISKTPYDSGFSTLDAMAAALDIVGEYEPPGPDFGVSNTWLQLMAPVYAEDHYTAADMQYVRAFTTVVWRPTSVQWIAHHRALLAKDAPSSSRPAAMSSSSQNDVASSTRAATEASGSGDVPATMHTHPPCALGRFLLDETLISPLWLAHVLAQSNVTHEDLDACGAQATFREHWAAFNLELPTRINTNHWVPERTVANVVAARLNLGGVVNQVQRWNDSVRTLLDTPQPGYTVLLALVHTVNEALDALDTQAEVLSRLRIHLAKLEQEHRSRLDLSSSSASSSTTSMVSTSTTRMRTTTQRASVTPEANEKESKEYGTVRQVARNIATTKNAKRFYDELEASERAVSQWQDVSLTSAEARVLAERLARDLLAEAPRRGGPALFASPEHVFCPSVGVYEFVAPGGTGHYPATDAAAYVSRNVRDPIRMPPHPHVLNDALATEDDNTSAMAAPRVEPRPFALQSIFTTKHSFRGMYPTWSQTVATLCASATAPDTMHNNDAAELAMTRATIAHWEELTHRLLTHAQSHFRLALLALDAPDMPDDEYFYAEVPPAVAVDNDEKKAGGGGGGNSNMNALMSIVNAVSVPRPTRFDMADPEALFSASERFLPDATALVSAARLFETNPQGDVGGETKKTTASGEPKRASGAASSKKSATACAGGETSYDAWMAFLSRVMPQATFIGHGIETMVRGTDWNNFLMLVVRCLRTSLLGGYRYAASDVPSFGTQLEFERLFLHAEDASIAALETGAPHVSSPVLALFREFIANNELVSMAVMREYVLRMIEWAPACETNVMRIFRDYTAFRRWTRLCTTMVRIDLRTNGGTMVGVQSQQEAMLKGRESDKGWAVFHTSMMRAFATEEFITWMFDRIVHTQVQRATWECVSNRHVGEHCIRRMDQETAQLMLDYVRSIEPGMPFQRHWLRDLGLDAYTVEMVHRMSLVYNVTDKRQASYYLYMLPPVTLTVLAQFFSLMTQHYIHQVVPLPPAYARDQQAALRRAFAVPHDEPLPQHLIDTFVCSPLACYELLLPVIGRRKAPGKQLGVRENYATGTLYCTSRHAQRSALLVPMAKTSALERAHKQHASNAEALAHGADVHKAFQRSRAELVAAADAVARTVVSDMYTYPCPQTPIVQMPTTGFVVQTIKRRKKRSMPQTEFTKCTRCGVNAVFHVNAISTNGFLCCDCLAADICVISDPCCVVCTRIISKTNDKEVVRQHNRRIEGERRRERAKNIDRYSSRTQPQLHHADHSFISADIKPSAVLLADDMTDYRVRPFVVCCLCWMRWMPVAQFYYTRAEFVYAALHRVNHPGELFPVEPLTNADSSTDGGGGNSTLFDDDDADATADDSAADDCVHGIDDGAADNNLVTDMAVAAASQ